MTLSMMPPQTHISSGPLGICRNAGPRVGRSPAPRTDGIEAEERRSLHVAQFS
ncbi:MAG: hypothetical protein J2P37_30260 [Ktedonobacteraceae bacterium]|nr:hypothetical protein [Ktedonobacteraceae bacterium]